MRAIVSLLVVTPMLGAQDWTQVSTNGPSPRAGQAMVFDPALGETLLFGGIAGTPPTPQADTWSWNGTRWQMLTPTPSPSARWSHAMAVDPVRGRVVLFGGALAPNTPIYSGETWEWGGTNWTQVALSAPAPSPRIWHAMAFDTVGSRILLFGGYDGNTSSNVLGDTWAWNSNTWTQLQPASSPTARTSPAMVTDPIQGVVTLFGGFSPHGGSHPNEYLSDTWDWTGNSWAQRSLPQSPSPRASHAMSHFPTLDQTFLFGGGDPTPFGDTWVLQSGQWQQINTATSPAARNWPAMAFDTVRARLVMFGGEGQSSGSGQWLGDTWECAAPASFQITGPGCPGSNGTPTLNPVPPSLPRVGQSFVVRLAHLYNQTATVVVACLGGPQVPPLNLTPFGMPSCLLHVVPYQNTFLFAYSGQVDWTIPVPPAPFLVGQTAHLQAFVVDPAAGNPLGAVVTNGGAATIGW